MTATTETRTVDANEYIESLTGFDEIAIEKRFGARWGQMADSSSPHANQTMLLRALVFVEFRRQGQSDPEAYESAMNLTLRAAQDYFPDQPEETVPDEPETVAGKDASDSPGMPRSLPPSASSLDRVLTPTDA